MDLGIRFPTERVKLQRQSVELSRLSGAERLALAFELYALCEALLTASPHRQRQLDVLARREDEQRRIWKALIKRHVCQQP